jgi:hypothetical protein
MARKDGKSGERIGPHRAASPEAVAWLTERGQMRDALKQAKLCFRDGATAEHRDLLERTYLLRVRELIEQAMPQAAAEVARDLLELGVSSDQRRADLATSLSQVGLTAEAARLTAQIKSPELLAGVQLRRVDLAVARPQGSTAGDAELQEKAERVRRAIDLLARNEETAALELLNDFPRQSPWADWRLFVRGLAAHYRGDTTTCRANWDRLDAQRHPARLASTLLRVQQLSQAAVAVEPEEKPATETSQGPKQTETLLRGKQLDEAFLAQVERAAFNQPISERIDRLRRTLREASENPHESTKAVVSAVESLRTALAPLDSRWPMRVTDIVQSLILDLAAQLSDAAAWKFLQDFSRVAAPLEIDPHWKRLFAQFVELEDPQRGADLWLEYSRSLEGCTSMPASRQVIARAVGRLSEAKCLHQQIVMSGGNLPYGDEFESPRGKPRQQLRGRMIESLRAAAQLAPNLRSVYSQAIDIANDSDDEGLALEFEEKLVDRFPEEIGVLATLANRYIGIGAYERADELYERLRAARPLDAQTAQVGMSLNLSRVRSELAANRCDGVARWLEQAAACSPHGANDYRLLVLRAVLALKSKPAKSKPAKSKPAKSTAKKNLQMKLTLADSSANASPSAGEVNAESPTPESPTAESPTAESPAAECERWLQSAGQQVGEAAALLCMRLEAGYCRLPAKTAASFMTAYRQALLGPRSPAKIAAVAEVMTAAVRSEREFSGFKTVLAATKKFLAKPPTKKGCSEEHATKYCDYLSEVRLMDRVQVQFALNWEKSSPNNPIVKFTCALAPLLVPDLYIPPFQTLGRLERVQQLIADKPEYAFLLPRIETLQQAFELNENGLDRFFHASAGGEVEDDEWEDEWDYGDEWEEDDESERRSSARGRRPRGGPPATLGSLLDLMSQLMRPEDIPDDIRRMLGNIKGER